MCLTCPRNTAQHRSRLFVRTVLGCPIVLVNAHHDRLVHARFLWSHVGKCCKDNQIAWTIQASCRAIDADGATSARSLEGVRYQSCMLRYVAFDAFAPRAELGKNCSKNCSHEVPHETSHISSIAGSGAMGGAIAARRVNNLANAAELNGGHPRTFRIGCRRGSRLTQRVFDKCILEKLRPPAEPLLHTWVQPGGPYYVGQWIWDTMFVVDLLSILPDKKQVIRDIFQNYWDFQDRWNPKRPAYAHDMVTVAIKTAPQEVRQFSQSPLLAWGLERVYRRNGDKELLKLCLGRLERFHDWFWRKRDVTDSGLIAVGSYSGVLQHAKWETYDYDCSMDTLKLTPHPTRKGPKKARGMAISA